ncbi:MAG: MotE family protein [Pseudochelatococcus sp.]|jgi:flagellar motility protein MotE (MotC chaperone)|uniref:MotE family protein n=1 Tax=Pseudochelatococcus sp. TaxID=2020869 RepID=UPI003D8B1BF8
MTPTEALKPLAFTLSLLAFAAGAPDAKAQMQPSAPAAGRGGPATGNPPPRQEPARGIAQETTQPAATAANPYCAAIVDAAADARFAWQAKTLEAMRLDIEERAARLEEKRAETEQWLRRRQEFLDNTEARIVSIYARMRPDAAAAQIAAMQDDAAVALLSKIDPRSASAILNEMEPGRAAHLTGVVTGVLKRTARNSAANKATP